MNPNLETVVDNIQDGIMIVNNECMITYVNNAFENISGYKHPEIIGKPCCVLISNACGSVHGKSGSNCCRLFQDCKIKKQKCTLIRKDGSVVNVVKNASVFVDKNGKTIGAVEIITDLTNIINKNAQIENYRSEIQVEDCFYGMIGTSPAMQRVYELIAHAADSDAPVVIYGESGTGKELVASALHQIGNRRNKPFVKVNCSALNEAILESEIFGHVKGAFTGAIRDRKGRFEAASGGYIFLDEIGDLPLSIQLKLLRVLEEKVVERVGENTPIPVNIRIISATNRDLRSLIAEGLFREDLFYRINAIPIQVPPLRDRKGDVPLLAEKFFQRIKLKNKRPIEGISIEALNLLARYAWPGNVRELKSTLEYAFVACRENMIKPEYLPENIFWNAGTRPAQSKGSLDIENLKRNRLVEALDKTGGNQSNAAKLLGISRTTVWSQIKRFGIDLKKYQIVGTTQVRKKI